MCKHLDVYCLMIVSPPRFGVIMKDINKHVEYLEVVTAFDCSDSLAIQTSLKCDELALK